MVNRRTGGLEIEKFTAYRKTVVNRRTGGLENNHAYNGMIADVNRRTGGLERYSFSFSNSD